MQIVEGGVEAQAKQALSNLMAVVEASGGDKSSVVSLKYQCQHPGPTDRVGFPSVLYSV